MRKFARFFIIQNLIINPGVRRVVPNGNLGKIVDIFIKSQVKILKY